MALLSAENRPVTLGLVSLGLGVLGGFYFLVDRAIDASVVPLQHRVTQLEEQPRELERDRTVNHGEIQGLRAAMNFLLRER